MLTEVQNIVEAMEEANDMKLVKNSFRTMNLNDSPYL